MLICEICGYLRSKMSALTKYLIAYFIFLCAVGGALYYHNSISEPLKVHPLSFYIFGFFALVFLLNHIFLLNADNKKPAVFIRRFMASSALRLFLFVIIIVGYAVTHKSLAVLFIWHVLIFYFLFTVFEVISLYLHSRKK